MLSFIKKQNLFYRFFLIWLLITSVVCFKTSDFNSFVFINHARSLFADVLFTIMTYLGDGIGITIFVLIFLLRKNYTLSIELAISYIIVGVINNYLKHYFNCPRPLSCYGTSIVETARWITLYSKYSFPSGHTAAAFCAATVISLNLRSNKKAIIAAFLIACFTGYSRVYLGEHFLRDVWFGSLFGVLCGSFCFILISYYIASRKKLRTKHQILSLQETTG